MCHANAYLFCMAAQVDEVLDDLLDNADFEEEDSLEKARKFVTAAKRFLILSPQTQADQGSSLTMSVQQIENMLRRAQEFVRSAAATGSVRFLSASEGFRR